MANQVWTEFEKTFIQQNADKVTDAVGATQLSEIVGRKISIHSYRKKRQEMGIQKAHGRGVCRVVTSHG